MNSSSASTGSGHPRYNHRSSASVGSGSPCHNCRARYVNDNSIYDDDTCKGRFYQDTCKGQFEASRAPLCSLPQYMASRYAKVRRAAKARFIELREEVVYG